MLRIKFTVNKSTPKPNSENIIEMKKTDNKTWIPLKNSNLLKNKYKRIDIYV